MIVNFRVCEINRGYTQTIPNIHVNNNKKKLAIHYLIQTKKKKIKLNRKGFAPATRPILKRIYDLLTNHLTFHFPFYIVDEAETKSSSKEHRAN